MGTLPQLSVISGAKRKIDVAPISRLFEKYLETNLHSEDVALIYKDETTNARVSYKELNSITNKIARVLNEHYANTKPNRDGDFIIAVCMKPSHSTIEILLSIWKSGACYLPLEPSFPQPRIEHILKDSQPMLVIYDESADSSMFAGVNSLSFDELLQMSAGKSDAILDDQERFTQDNNPTALVLYTSGSTGVPKGVRLRSSAVCNRIFWQFREFPFMPAERTCVWKTAITFVDAVCEIWCPLICGRTLIILPKELTRDPKKLCTLLEEFKIQRLVLVPTLLSSILMYLSMSNDDKKLSWLKLWICSGETLTKELVKNFFQYFGDHKGYRLSNFYGSTEVMGDITHYTMYSYHQVDNFNSVPIGRVVDNCTIYICDSEMNPVAVGETGELWAAGWSLADGYVGSSGADKFVHNPHSNKPELSRLYKTGDYSRIDKGMLVYCGRTDSQVKIRGNRVDIMEVDVAINSLDDVEKGLVLYHADVEGGVLIAFVTTKPTSRVTAKMLEDTLSNKLPFYMLPQVMVIDNLPLLVNGKVDRQSLLKMYGTTNNNDDTEIEVDIDYSGVNPMDVDKAKVLFGVVGDVLGRSVRSTINTSANFYELGGNSLNSIYTITKLKENGYFIEISDFLNAVNLGEILKRMQIDKAIVSEENNKGSKFTADMLRDNHKSDVIDMIVTSFYEKADLEQWVINEIETDDYRVLIDACWVPLLEANLSVVLKSSDTNQLVAVALNFDARSEPEVELKNGLAKIMEFLESIEAPVRDTMLPGGINTVLHSFMMATKSSLDARDNVTAIKELEHATMRVAAQRNFKGVFTTNTSPLTQQLACDVLGFNTMFTCQVNQYTTQNGDRPFGAAPDDQLALVCWKPIET